jgi:guanylate kinase
MQKRILVIAGPSGVGESTVTRKLIERFPRFTRLVTATTRTPRANEQDGVDYYFFTPETFQNEIKNGNIIECQNNRDNVYYGSYKPDLEKKLTAGFTIIVNPDIVGAKFYKENYNATTIFLLPDSMENLRQRHQARNAHADAAELEKRLAYARREIEEESGYYDYRVTNVQGKLEETLTEIIGILQKEEYELAG